jgi:hypothetical protein
MTEMSNTEIMDKGFKCLLENLGVIETEKFIALINRERFDYTEWRRDLFDDMTPEEFNAAAVEYAKAHPFQPKRELKPIE